MITLRSRLGRIIAVLIVATLCSGCWDSIELERRALVAAVAIDLDEDGQIMVTQQVIKPRAGNSGSNEASYLNVSGVGSSVAEARRVLDRQIPDLAFLATAQIMIISEDAAKTGISDYLDSFLRRREPRETMKVAIARGSAAALLTADNLGPIPAYGLAQLLDEQRLVAEVPTANLLDLRNAILGEGAPYLPLLELHYLEGIRHAQIIGTVVFDEDTPAGVLDFPAGRGLIWALGLVRGGNAPLRGVTPHGEFGLNIMALNSAIKVSVVDGAPMAIIDVEVEGDIISASDGTPTGSSEGLGDLEIASADAMRLEIEALIGRMKELCLDLLDLGDRLRAYHPRQWKELEQQWPEPLRQLKTDIRITMSVERTGLIKDTHEPQ